MQQLLFAKGEHFFNHRYHPSLQVGSSRHPSQSIPRGLPSTSNPHPSHSHPHLHPPPHQYQHHVGEKRKTRPPSLSHDSDDDVQIVGHHYSTGASQPRAKITASETRDFGGHHYSTGASQPQTKITAHERDFGGSRARVGEVGASSQHREAGARPLEEEASSSLLGHRGQPTITTTTTTKERSHHHEQRGYDADRYRPRHAGMEQFSAREPQQHQHRYQSGSHLLDPHTNSSHKKHKQKGERGVRFHH